MTDKNIYPTIAATISTYSRPNIPSFPARSRNQNILSSTIYNPVQRLSGAIDASESATRGIYCRNISGKLAALPRYIRWQSRPFLPPLEDGIYAEVNRLLPRKSEVIEC